MGCTPSTMIGTLAPFEVAAGARSSGGGDRPGLEGAPPHARRIPGATTISPAAAPARPRKPRRDTAGDHATASNSLLAAGDASVPTGIQSAALVRPDDIGLERLHGLGVGIDLHALVRLLDAPVDHVPERGELVHLLLELRELVRMIVRGERVAHGARHPCLRELNV